MTLVRLTNVVTAAQWLAECESALATAIDTTDLDRVVEAAGVRALALHGLREIEGPTPAVRRRPVRRFVRSACFDRAALMR